MGKFYHLKFFILFKSTIIAMVFLTPFVYGQMDEYSNLFYILPLLYIVGWVSVFIIRVIAAIYMYRDAEKRGETGVLWAIVGVIAGLTGLIVWLIIRKDKPIGGYRGYPYQYPYPPPNQYYPYPNQRGYGGQGTYPYPGQYDKKV